jgi:hypothetical protein
VDSPSVDGTLRAGRRGPYGKMLMKTLHRQVC